MSFLEAIWNIGFIALAAMLVAAVIVLLVAAP